MSGEAATKDDQPVSRLESYILGERADDRRHRRIVITLPVRFMAEGGDEHRALLFDMSPGGVSVTSDVKPEIGVRVVLYIDDIGRCEGAVTRQHPFGFAVRLTTTQNRRDRIAERLTFHASRHRLRDEDLRIHERVASERNSFCVLPDGAKVPCRVLDLSLSGAALAIKERPELGAEVSIGRMLGRVVRHHAQGIAIQFFTPATSPAAIADHL